ncbi:MAG: SET domain-containing protein-lysine N-methyltransferase [Betaproteobacteria bacterium]|nr:MAG: SET domain-containing protein-lysine N-methyltransferase [Betaproteobacteria bacterium]
MSRTQSRGGRRISVRRSPIHGLGVFALKKIRKGERIIEYTGERISHREADRRYPNDDSPHTMLFIVDKKIVIDATREGNSARWINHSCRPNCESVEEKKRMYIEAIRDIRKGEELSYDYNLVLDERHTPAAKRENPCFCGVKRCRGTLLGPKR